MHRQTPRVLLRRPRPGTFDEANVLVTEIGLGGLKFEHSGRLDVNRCGTLVCGPLRTRVIVRHSELLPAERGVVYCSGVAFVEIEAEEKKLIFDLLVQEAKEQVVEWEANLAGEAVPKPRIPIRHSSVALRFVSLKLSPQGWSQTVTLDPNQPVNGVLVLEGTPDAEISLLRKTYEGADDTGRDLMRRIATVAILERLRSTP